MSNPITIKLVTPDGTFEVHGTTANFIGAPDDWSDQADELTVHVDKVITTELLKGTNE